MKEYDKLVINELLNSYEKSTLYTGKNERNISVDFKFTPKNIPEYFDQTSSLYEDIHILMHKLEEQKLAVIIWKGRKENHIISKVSLDLNHIDEAYRYVNRKSLRSISDKMMDILNRYKFKDEVSGNLCNWAIGRINSGQSVKKYIDISDPKSTIDLLEGVHAVVTNTVDYYIRELSTLIYKDSKKLEAVVGRIEAIIKEFHTDRDKFHDTYDILGEFNIARNPTLVMFKGVGSFVINGYKGKLTSFPHGIGISSNDLPNVRFNKDTEVKQVITIENLTSFNRFQREDALMIYLGGFHNTARRNLLLEIHHSCPEAEYLHWGDIDVGGFRIFIDLCKKTGIHFQTMYMNAEVLEKYKEYAKELSSNDRRELDRIIADNEISGNAILTGENLNTLRRMREWNVKLEQEVVLEA